MNSILIPNLWNVSGINPKSLMPAFLIVSSDPVIAAIPMKLPTSIMSASKRCVVPFNLLTPFIINRFEPIPLISAPIETNILHN